MTFFHSIPLRGVTPITIPGDSNVQRLGFTLDGCIASICRGLVTALLFTAVLGVVGCGQADSGTDPVPIRPWRKMNSEIRKGRWSQAWDYADQVMIERPDDPTALSTVAQVAHQVGKPKEAAELLVKACEVESFANPTRVQQALVALIGVGQLMEGIELLEAAIEVDPSQHGIRRLLFDLTMGSELRQRGLPHGKFLVRSRKFDLELLQTISNTERRTQENAPLEEMISRNPQDKRPRLGEAKLKFDQGELDESITLLRGIVAEHPDHAPAQALLGRALAASGDFDAVEQWAGELSSDVHAYPGYWLAIGDWARSKQLSSQAARSYWEATQCDPDVMESWSKLATELRQVADARPELSNVLEAVQRRATLLSTFNQLKQRFSRTGAISRALVVEIAETLDLLGRAWEAEAWAAVGLTLPEDDAVNVEQARGAVVAKLSQTTPWQITTGFPELQLRLDDLVAPSISQLAESVIDVERDDARTGILVDHIRLVNEAQQRGVRFFGRTADDLDQPGIMLFKTLGCGGGTIDFDLDGWSDLYFAAAGGTPPAKDSSPNALFRNLAGDFIDVTSVTGTGERGFGQGVAVGDVNEDGFPDLLILNYGPNSLLLNNGDGTFQDVSERLPKNDESWSTAAAIADIDGDSINDVVIVNYCAGLDPVTVPCPMKDTDIMRSCTPVKFTAATDQFLQGTSSGFFRDSSSDWSAASSVPGRGLGVIAGAFDQQPGVDLLIANDMTNNHYWSETHSGQDARQKGGFQLSESAMLRGLGTDDRSLPQGSMGIAAADFDSDGDLDFYVTNFDGEYNTLHDQRSDGIWQDLTARLKLARPTLPLVGFGTEAIDLDSDGALELVVSNGHVEIFSDGDQKSIYSQPMQVFRRNSSGTYDSISFRQAGEYLSGSHVGRSLWTIDVNRDGMLDVAVTHQTEPVAVLVNRSDAKGTWVAFELAGSASSRDAVGARVTVRGANGSYAGFQLSGDGYLCSNERILRFGLGQDEGPCELTVEWPDGTMEIHENLDVNQQWIVVQGHGISQAF